jgi:AraC family transcriptional regulator
MANVRGHQKESANHIDEDVNFSRPFFAETDRMDRANYLSPSLSVGGISVGNYRNDVPKLGISEPNILMPVYYVPIMLKNIPARKTWRDGRYHIYPPLPVGTLTSFDLRHRWETDLNYSFHTVSCYIPQAAFDELTEDLCQPRIEPLSCVPSQVSLDPVAYHLARALEPIIDSTEPIPSLLVDQILTAMRFHLATRYGGLRLPESPEGRFTPYQIQALKAILLDDPWRHVRLTELAEVCGLPTSIFERAFRKQFGRSPHQWRLVAKVKHARRLLEYTQMPLADIAFKCGFSDQAHLTRVFSRITGLTPGVYRRARRD